MVYVEKDTSIWGYLHNEMVFCYKLLSIFIIHQGFSFGGIALKIEFVAFVYELINYEIIFLLLGYIIIPWARHRVSNKTKTKQNQTNKNKTT